jgi:membrane protein implicated in regulation of membrane protease activity
MNDENSLWITTICSLTVLAAASLSYKFIEPNQGLDWKAHAAYGAVAVVLIAFLPVPIASYVFTELTVTLVGCVYPIYRATKAVCTPEESESFFLTALSI